MHLFTNRAKIHAGESDKTKERVKPFVVATTNDQDQRSRKTAAH
jgi:hypothetical protein